MSAQSNVSSTTVDPDEVAKFSKLSAEWWDPTGKMAPLPILLFGVEFWQRVINLEALAEFGTISPEDVALMQSVDTAQEAFRIIQDFYREEPA